MNADRRFERRRLGQSRYVWLNETATAACPACCRVSRTSEEAFITRLSGRAAPSAECGKSLVARPAAEASSPRDIVGLLTTSVLPIAVFLLTPRSVIGDDAIAFLSITAATVSMWAFGLVDEFVPALIMLIATLALELTPVGVVLGGFASETFL